MTFQCDPRLCLPTPLFEGEARSGEHDVIYFGIVRMMNSGQQVTGIVLGNLNLSYRAVTKEIGIFRAG